MGILIVLTLFIKPPASSVLLVTFISLDGSGNLYIQ